MEAMNPTDVFTTTVEKRYGIEWCRVYCLTCGKHVSNGDLFDKDTAKEIAENHGRTHS